MAAPCKLKVTDNKDAKECDHLGDSGKITMTKLDLGLEKKTSPYHVEKEEKAFCGKESQVAVKTRSCER